MAGRTSNDVGSDRPLATRDEIDALGEVIAATIVVAARTRSLAAAALLERALETLDDRARAAEAPADSDSGGGQGKTFRPS